MRSCHRLLATWLSANERLADPWLCVPTLPWVCPPHASPCGVKRVEPCSGFSVPQIVNGVHELV